MQNGVEHSVRIKIIGIAQHADLFTLDAVILHLPPIGEQKIGMRARGGFPQRCKITITHIVIRVDEAQVVAISVCYRIIARRCNTLVVLMEHYEMLFIGDLIQQLRRTICGTVINENDLCLFEVLIA